jgi:hypothetical protein
MLMFENIVITVVTTWKIKKKDVIVLRRLYI